MPAKKNEGKTLVQMTPEEFLRIKLECYKAGHTDGWNAFRTTQQNLLNHDYVFSCDERPERLPDDLAAL